MLIFIILIIAIVLLFMLWKKFKYPKFGSVALITGAPKTGKSTFGVALARKEYKRRCRKTRFKNFFRKIVHKPLIQMPIIYSNIPLSIPYCPVTDDLLTRRKRFEYNCVIYICECSLVADSMCIKDKIFNEEFLEFNKLIGHETKGGCLIYDTQSIADNHYAVKRCLSNYFYIHHLTKWIPFIMIAHIRELLYCDDGSTQNAFNEDIEETMKCVIISKRVWKWFDCYCYSTFTDNLPVVNDVIKSKDLKANEIVSFKDKELLNKTLYKNFNKEK